MHIKDRNFLPTLDTTEAFPGLPKIDKMRHIGARKNSHMKSPENDTLLKVFNFNVWAMTGLSCMRKKQ